eukprot:UN06604
MIKRKNDIIKLVDQNFSYWFLTQAIAMSIYLVMQIILI